MKSVLAQVVEVRRIKGGTGSVEVQYGDNSKELVDVVAEGWGDPYDRSSPRWPPQVGDVVTVRRQTVVIVKERKGKETAGDFLENQESRVDKLALEAILGRSEGEIDTATQGEGRRP